MPNYPEITSRKIKYDSPSGFVWIGKYIPPFEKVENGFGFKGVVVEDFKSGKLQCHVCGEWFEQLPGHVRKHNLTAPEYKRKFGLLMSTALKSKKMRLDHSKVMQRLRAKNKSNRYSFQKNNGFAGNRKGKAKAEESRNKFGVCDLQIMQKVIELRDELGKTPTLTQLRDRYGAGFIFHLHKRYRSYIAYCKKIGFSPSYSNFNPKYNRDYFIQKAMNGTPELRIFTDNEQRALYRHFKSIKELRSVVAEIRGKQNE